MDTTVYKGERLEKKPVLDLHTHYKPFTETFQYTYYTYNSCHPADVKKGFVKGEALRFLRANGFKVTFDETITEFKARLVTRGFFSHREISDLSNFLLAVKDTGWFKITL